MDDLRAWVAAAPKLPAETSEEGKEPKSGRAPQSRSTKKKRPNTALEQDDEVVFLLKDTFRLVIGKSNKIKKGQAAQELSKLVLAKIPDLESFAEISSNDDGTLNISFTADVDKKALTV